jgi:hypothetical protein
VNGCAPINGWPTAEPVPGANAGCAAPPFLGTTMLVCLCTHGGGGHMASCPSASPSDLRARIAQLEAQVVGLGGTP